MMPLTFSQCESDPGLTKPLQFFQVHGNATKSACTSKSSGSEIPGGFGWLRHDTINGNCSLDIRVTTEYPGDNSNSIPNDCKTQFDKFQAQLAAGIPVEVLVPIFDKKSGAGSEHFFHVEAFAQISLRGWRFPDSTYLTPDAQALSNSLNHNHSHAGLYAKYVKKISLAEAAVLGGPATYQALGIRLSG